MLTPHKGDSQEISGVRGGGEVPKCAAVKLQAVVSPGECDQEVAGSTRPWMVAPLQEGPAWGQDRSQCAPHHGRRLENWRAEVLEEGGGGKRQFELLCKAVTTWERCFCQQG